MLCSNCGKEVGEQVGLCENCREALSHAKDDNDSSEELDSDSSRFSSNKKSSVNKSTTNAQQLATSVSRVVFHAGALRRILSGFFDFVVLFIPSFILCSNFIREHWAKSVYSLQSNYLISGGWYAELSRHSLIPPLDVFATFFAAIIVAYLIGFLYFPMFETSFARATPGKMMLQIELRGNSGEDIDLQSTLIRHLARGLAVLPSLVVIFSLFSCRTGASCDISLSENLTLIGLALFLLLLFVLLLGLTISKNSQTVHDILSSTIVTKRHSASVTHFAFAAGTLVVVFLGSFFFASISNTANMLLAKTESTAKTHSSTFITPPLPFERNQLNESKPAVILDKKAEVAENQQTAEAASGFLVIGDEKFPLADSIAVFSPQKNRLEIGFYLSPLGDDERKTISQTSVLRSSTNPVKPVVTVSINFEQTLEFSRDDIDSYFVFIYRDLANRLSLPSNRSSLSFAREGAQARESRELFLEPFTKDATQLDGRIKSVVKDPGTGNYFEWNLRLNMPINFLE